MRILHTFDWHIGKGFGTVDNATRGVLRGARLEAITRLGQLAQAQGAVILTLNRTGDIMHLSLAALHSLVAQPHKTDGVRLALRVAVLLMVVATPAGATPAPTFDDPVGLVGWLLGRSGHGFDALDDAASEPVFSPGLRAAVRASMLRSRQRNEPPCGANGDFIRNTQEDGKPQNVRLSAQPTAADRRTVAASYDVDGYHRERRFMVVLLDGAWKVENIVEADGISLRRSLDCRR